MGFFRDLCDIINAFTDSHNLPREKEWNRRNAEPSKNKEVKSADKRK